MANSPISQYLARILSSVYGRDVRQAIHDAIQQCYTDGAAGITPVITTEEVTTGIQVNITVGANTTSFIVENGTATNEQVETYVQEWLDDHPEATTTVVTDTTLSVAGMAGDAKTIGDAIDELNSDVALKINLPVSGGDLDYGEAGYVLVSNGDGTFDWVEMSSGEIVKYTITNRLAHVTNGNGATSIRENKAYNAVLTPDSNAEMKSVVITMNGVDITSSVYDSQTASISIPSVTGNVVITAKAQIVALTSVTWSGSGSDKTAAPDIDASDYDVYYVIPYVTAASQLSSSAELGGNAFAIHANLYSLDDGSFLGWYDFRTDEIKPGSGWTWAQAPIMTFGDKIRVAPHGYKVRLVGCNNKGAFTSNSACGSYLNNYASTVTLVSPDEEPEPEPELSNAERTDRDLLQVYETRSLSTATAADPATYEGVLEEAKNAWMMEYGGSINKIPLIIHTDQHDTMGDEASKAMWETIDNMVCWYDVSKVLNLGDTTNSYDNFDDPLLGDTALDNYLEATKNIPCSKRIEVFGNHDCMKIINASLTYIQHNQGYLSPYFKNVMARKTSDNGYHVTYDPYFNVKYIVYSTYDYVDASHYDLISSDQYDFLIEEMSKNDGYDIIICGHQDSDVYRENLGTLVSARYNKTPGSFTDRLGVSHTYDFTNCENDLLVGLHGHSHSDGYNYTNDMLSQCFANYYDSTRPIYFVIVDREIGQLKVWKVTKTPAITTYTRPFVEPEPETT